MFGRVWGDCRAHDCHLPFLQNNLVDHYGRQHPKDTVEHLSTTCHCSRHGATTASRFNRHGRLRLKPEGSGIVCGLLVGHGPLVWFGKSIDVRFFCHPASPHVYDMLSNILFCRRESTLCIFVLLVYSSYQYIFLSIANRAMFAHDK